jgi:hypothetical protein
LRPVHQIDGTDAPAQDSQVRDMPQPNQKEPIRGSVIYAFCALHKSEGPVPWEC